MFSLILFPFAFCLDLVLGDPPSRPHPVRLIGLVLDRLEPPGQRLSATGQRLYGLGVAIALSAAVGASAALLVRVPGLGWIIALWLSYLGLALGQLLREAKNAAALIRAGRLPEARKALSYLVSRDTSALDEADLWRTLAETVSENFCDAFVAPGLYLSLGGPVLQWVYKTVSTMDSMWGYKTDRYLHMGWAGARADDILAFIPARLAALFLLAAGWMMGLPAGIAFRSFGADARKMSSPNAGWPMAASAWLCGGTMGGAAVYFGKATEKPVLGPADQHWNDVRFTTLTRLVFVAGCIMVVSIPTILRAISVFFL